MHYAKSVHNGNAGEAGMKRILNTTVVLLSAGGSPPAQEPRPPLNALRITGEIVAGEVFAGAGLVGAFFLAHALENVFANIPGYMETPLSLSFVAIFGCVGVSLVGIIGNEKGSYWAASAGGAAGVLVGCLLDVIRPNYTPFAFLPYHLGVLPIMWFIPAVGATIGFNFSRRYKSTYPRSKLGYVGSGRNGL